ncbi:MAG: ABC transporter ATP-binding protein [Christensenellales bacterium]
MIDAKGLSKIYGKKTYLNSVSLKLRRGRALAVAGGNGAGKTTLLKILATAASPDEGSLFINGVNALEAAAEARELIGYVPQSVALMQELSVKDNLYYWMKKKDGFIYSAVLDLIGLKDVEKKRVSKLSGGMQRRLNLGAALVLRAPLLILDEPLAGVDASNRRRIVSGLNDIKKNGVSIVFVSHDLEEIKSLADELLVLRDGAVSYHGSLDFAEGIGSLAEAISRYTA